MLVFSFWFLWATKELLIFAAKGVDPYLMYRVMIFLGPAFLGPALIIWLNQRGPLHLARGSCWFPLYLIWAGASLSWTESDKMLGTTGAYVGMVGEWAGMALMFSERDSANRAFTHAMAGIVAGGLLNLAFVLALLDPSSGVRSAEGVLLHPQIFGTRMAFGAIAAVYLARASSRGWMLWVALFLVGGIVATGSKTAIVATSVLVAAFVTRMPGMRLRTRILCFAGAVLLALLAFPAISEYLSAYANSGAAGTLTGRIPLWSEIWGSVQARPILGYGFGSAYGLSHVESPFQAIHAHNELLQQWYTLGTIGLVLAAGTYIQFYRHASRLEQGPRITAIALLIFVLIRGITDPEAVGLVLPAPMLAMFACLPRAGRQANVLRSLRRPPAGRPLLTHTDLSQEPARTSSLG